MKKSDALAIEYWPLSRVVKKRWTRNAKLHDIGKLCESIERYGFRDPIGYDATLDAFAEGNGRAEALVALKARGPVKGKPWPPRGIQNGSGSEWQVPILVGVDARTKYEAEAYALDHNNLTMSGGDFSALDMARMWDANLNQVLLDLAANDTFSVVMDSDTVDALVAAQAGFGQADAEPQIDKAEELNRKWKVKTGDLWRIGEHRLYCGESQQGLDVMLGNLKPDAVITDPPYGINIVKGISAAIGGAKPFGRVRQRGGRRPKIMGKVGRPGVVEPRLYHPVANDDKPFDPTWLLSLAKVCVLFGANHYASRLPNSPSWIVWDKGVSDQSTFSACELIWSNVGNHIKRYEWRWSGMVRAGERDIEMQDRIHPTQKPVGLFENIIRDYSGDGAIVFDPYLGSGTTMLASARTNRICIAGELDAAYCAVTLQRMADAFPGIEIERIEHGKTKHKARGNGKAAR